MHASSLENMQKCYERFVWGDWMQSRESISVLDVGGADVNGSYADIFSEPRFDYCAADLDEGPGVRVVLEDPYRLPFNDGSIDLVISGQAFEHVEYFWDLFREMTRVVRQDGFIFLIAPSAGPIHQYPVDCYRFYPDSFRALAKYSQMSLVDLWMDDGGPWNDLVGVFSKTPFPTQPPEKRREAAADFEMNDYRRKRAPAPVITERGDSAVEPEAGDQDRYDVLRAIHKTLQPRFYLEIGVRHGQSLALATCPAVAIDPQPELGAVSVSSTKLFRETSDYFFEFDADEALAGRPLDLVLIDGMHSFEFALRDFLNLERRAHPNSVFVLDDIFPNNDLQSTHPRQTAIWTGDVWKLYLCLVLQRPDLKLFPLNSRPTGLLAIANLDANNQTLRQEYNPLVRQYRDVQLDDWRDLILGRKDALSSSDPSLFDLLRQVRQARERDESRGAA